MVNNILQSGLIKIFMLSLLLSACTNDESKSIDILRVAVLSDQNETVLHERFQPLVNYLSSYTRLPGKLVVPNSYSELLTMFKNKQIDIALFGGVTYVKAHEQSGAVPLVMRNVDGTARSVALVSIDNTADTLDEIRGGVLAFGSRLSTTGYYIPKYFLQKHNMDIDRYFSEVKYSGAHDLTAEWVRDGKVTAGMSNSGIVNNMFMDGRLKKDSVKVIWQSPPFADYVWAIQSDINQQQINQIRNAFLSMGSDKESESILMKLGAEYYIPASNDDFNEVRDIIRIIENKVGEK